jgi:hypothetical protein
MREKMALEERRSRRGRLSNIRGRVGQAKKRLDSALVLAKRTGQIWEWRVNNILEDLRILIANLEREENKLRE